MGKEMDKWGASVEQVTNDESKIKWSSSLKECFIRKIEAKFVPSSIRNALYRPFARRFLYFDSIVTHRQGMFPIVLSTPYSRKHNYMAQSRLREPMFALATNVIPDLLPQGGSQCFLYYTYSEDGSNQRENITDWALTQFQAKYGTNVSKWDIFHYVYILLHHPQYRERYAENLKRDLPRIPLLASN